MKRRSLLATVTAAALALPIVATSISSAATDPVDRASEQLRHAVTLDGVMRHMQAFQQFANANSGTRASGTPGYELTVSYVADQLKRAGYQVTLQEFDFPFFQEKSPAVLQRVTPEPKSYQQGGDYRTMTYSGTGDVTAPVQPVDLALADPAASTSGCEASDFAGFTPGNIALVQRGTCTFGQKAQNAAAAGAKAVIVFNQGTPGHTDAFAATLGGPVVSIPVLGASFAVGQELAQPGTTARIRTDTIVETRKTRNVIAQTRKGRADNVVMLGAHLDSVVGGPGINDNGSGSAVILETALQLARSGIQPRNQVRFAWWGTEELGLLGSEHYVASLPEGERKKIALYLNFDMVGSPNYARLVYDGDDSDKVGAGPGPEGSAQIEKLFERHFAAEGLPYEGTDFTGRSDYGPFIAVGIPAGGLFTGAEEQKTPEQVAKYGGIAGVAFDYCYHQACDTINNLNAYALDTNADAVAHATATYALDTSSVNGKLTAGNAGKAVRVKKQPVGHQEDAAA